MYEKLTETSSENKKTVVLENTDIKIIVSDELPPEANAMALAMYSRDPRSFLVHLGDVLQKGWEKFISLYYVGYGHLSIGDCGSTTICAEGVSMLCAKAIQHYLLYKGQEASTRYLNMSTQKILNPLESAAGQKIQDTWMEVYNHLLSVLVPDLKERFPRSEEQSEKVYERAINAKAFDIARSFLPAGATTYVGWHTTLREAVVHLLELRHHPLAEVRMIAEEMSRALHSKYPSSGFDKRYPDTEKYVETYMAQVNYLDAVNLETFFENDLEMEHIMHYTNLLADRPVKTELPTFMRKFGTIRYNFLLDFGSFRDLQRHRSGTILMPLLTTTYGFEPWYLAQIPERYRTEILTTIEKQIAAITGLDCDDATRQNYIAMGFQVACECTLPLPSAVYIAELRSGQTVHPTLRFIAQKMGRTLAQLFPDMALYCDFEPDVWDIKRGTQTIEKKV